MTNPRHLSASVEWYSPALVVLPSQALLGGIELDPASCEVANRGVGAERFYTREDDALSKTWKARTAFVNPPGGKDGNRSLQNLFWQKLARSWMARDVGSAIFLCFSVELLQVSQGYAADMPIPLDFPLCFPRGRIPYIKASEDVVTRQASLFASAADVRLGEAESPPHASVIVYLPPEGIEPLGLGGGGAEGGFRAHVNTHGFREGFSPVGRCLWAREGW